MTATATGGGRDGRTSLEDSMSLQLVVPKELGGPGGEGANPEKLFALGYSACYLGAMTGRLAADQDQGPRGLDRDGHDRHRPALGRRLRASSAALDCYLPGLSEADAKTLTDATHGICPYSNAIRASVDVPTHVRT